MKLVKATWEMLNLGVSTSEIIIERNDNLEEHAEQIEILQEEYIVLKIPSYKSEFINYFIKNHFNFIETQFSMEHNKKKYLTPSIYERYLKDIVCLKAESQDIKKILEVIKTGEFFLTDRISMDTYFSPSQSGNRYYNWVKAMLKDNAYIYIIKYRDVKVGFSMHYKITDTTYNAVLGGVFPRFEKRGLGFLPLHANMSSIYEKGGRHIVTAVSSNNMPMLRLHILFGFNMTDACHVLVKHSS